MVKNPPAKAGDIRGSGSIPGLGRSPGEGNDNPLQYSCLENPLDRGTWQAEAEAPILWPPEAKSCLIGKDPDAGKDGRQEKGITKDKLVGWHY